MKEINVKIKGSDYSRVEDAIVVFDDENNEEIVRRIVKSLSINFESNENEEKRLKDIKLKITELALKHITLKNGKLKDDKYIINHTRKGRSNNYDCLWTQFISNKTDKSSMWFQGVVGVLRFKINSTNLKKEENNSKSVSEEKESNNEETIVFNISLQVQSRFDIINNKLNVENNQEKEKLELGKPYFLITMLLRENIDLTKSTVQYDDESIYDYMLFYLYKSRFVNAVQKGFFRSYRRYEKNDDKLKGVIDISRHIKLNAGRKNGKIAYTYRENTVDNFINCLIVKAYDCLKRKYYDLVEKNFDNNIELKKAIDSLKMQLSDYNMNDNYIINKSLKSISHPFYIEYEELREISIRILRDEGISIFEAEHDDVEGILYYLPDLWEEYLDEKIKAYDNIYFSSQANVKVFGSKFIQTTIPDYLFYLDDKKSSNEIFMVLDAKFKPAWSKIMDDGKIGSRYLPDFDKCIRDMVTTNCSATGVVFPMNNADIKLASEEETDEGEDSENVEEIKLKEEKSHAISEINQGKIFYTIPINIPYSSKESNYDEWKKIFDDNMKKGIDEMIEIINKESEIFRKTKGIEGLLNSLIYGARYMNIDEKTIIEKIKSFVNNI